MANMVCARGCSAVPALASPSLPAATTTTITTTTAAATAIGSNLPIAGAVRHAAFSSLLSLLRHAARHAANLRGGYCARADSPCAVCSRDRTVGVGGRGVWMKKPIGIVTVCTSCMSRNELHAPCCRCMHGPRPSRYRKYRMHCRSRLNGRMRWQWMYQRNAHRREPHEMSTAAAATAKQKNKKVGMTAEAEASPHRAHGHSFVSSLVGPVV